MKRLVVWVLISLIILCSSIAQASNQNLLSGKITIDGNPVPNAVVTLYLLNKEQSGYDKSISSRTSDVGLYRFDVLTEGNYILVVTKEGQRVYQGKIAINKQLGDVKNIDLTASLFTGNWKLNLQRSRIPASYEIVDGTRTYSKKGEVITVRWSRAFKNGKSTMGKYEFRCDGKKWITGGQTISCTYNYRGSSAIVEGEKSPPHEYFRNEVNNKELIITTFTDSQHKQLILKEVFYSSK